MYVYYLLILNKTFFYYTTEEKPLNTFYTCPDNSLLGIDIIIITIYNFRQVTSRRKTGACRSRKKKWLRVEIGLVVVPVVDAVMADIRSLSYSGEEVQHGLRFLEGTNVFL